MQLSWLPLCVKLIPLAPLVLNTEADSLLQVGIPTCCSGRRPDLEKIANGELGDVEEVLPLEDPTYQAHMQSLRWMSTCMHPASVQHPFSIQSESDLTNPTRHHG